MIPEFPDRFKRYADRNPNDGWLDALPGILDLCCSKWNLTLGPVVKEVKANYVGYATLLDGDEVILKVGPRSRLDHEMEALKLYDGCGINRMIDCNKELGALLLERFRPGTDRREDYAQPARDTAARFGSL